MSFLDPFQETLGSVNAREGPGLDPQKVDRARPKPTRENVDAPAWAIHSFDPEMFCKKSPKHMNLIEFVSFVFICIWTYHLYWIMVVVLHPQSISIFKILQIQCEAITILSYLYIICDTWFDNMSFLFIYKLPSRYVMLSYHRFSNRRISPSIEALIASYRPDSTKKRPSSRDISRFSSLKNSPVESSWSGDYTEHLWHHAELVFSNWKPVDLLWFYFLEANAWNWSLCKYTMTISNQRHKLFKVGSTFRSARSNPSSVADNMAMLYISTAEGASHGKVPAPLWLKLGLQNQQSPL